ncbi:outer membrane beta-barrel protein [bacterium]|nr:outer membrane beta-barrel protein [bacterium]
MRFPFFFLIFIAFHFLHYHDSCVAQSQLTVAVLEFNNSAELSANEISALTQRFRSILTSRQIVTVLERDKMSEILKEQDFILSDNCNTRECAVQVGQLLGVQVMISGEFGKVGDAYAIDVRCIDVETGRIFFPLNMNYSGKREGLLNIVEELAEAIKFNNKATKKKYISSDQVIRLKLAAGPTVSLAKSSFFKIGYSVTAAADLVLNERVSISAGLSYMVKKTSQTVGTSHYEATYKYIELPFLLQYTLFEQLTTRSVWAVSIGYAPAFKLKSTYENIAGDENNVTSATRQDGCFLAGIALLPRRGFGFYAIFSAGLQPVRVERTIYHRTVYSGATYTF